MALGRQLTLARSDGAGAFVLACITEQRSLEINQVITEYQVTVPGVGTFEGDMLVSMTFSGDKTNELQADIRCAMTGALTFVPAV